MFCYAVKQHFLLVYCVCVCVCVVSTLWHIVCRFSLLPCCLVTGIEHSPWSWHRSTTFPSFPRLPTSTLTTAGDYISHGSLEEPRSVPISFVPGLKRQPSQAVPGTSLRRPQKRGGSAVGMLFVRAGCQALCPRSHFATCKKKAKCCGMIKQQGWHAGQVMWERRKVMGCHPSALGFGTHLTSSSEGTAVGRTADLSSPTAKDLWTQICSILNAVYFVQRRWKQQISLSQFTFFLNVPMQKILKKMNNK